MCAKLIIVSLKFPPGTVLIKAYFLDRWQLYYYLLLLEYIYIFIPGNNRTSNLANSELGRKINSTQLPNLLFSARGVKGGAPSSACFSETLILLEGAKVSRVFPGLVDAGVLETDLSGNEA